MGLLTGLKILVVDDDDLFREVVCEILSDEGAITVEAENGVKAFAMVKSEKPEIVVSDVRMPGGDGIAFAKDLLTIVGDRPILFICSGFNDLKPADLLKLEIETLIEKPFKGRDLVAALEAGVAKGK